MMKRIRIAIFAVVYSWSLPIFAAEPPPNTEASVQQQKIYEEARSNLLKAEREKPKSAEELFERKISASPDQVLYPQDIDSRNE